jgi:LPS-assembly lipoprotein
MTGKFGANAHPSVNESNTHTDGELLSPGFREGVGRLKLAIRLAALAQGDLDIGTLWAALHEVAVETLESDKGKEQAEVYWSKIREFADWQLTQPVSGSSPGAQTVFDSIYVDPIEGERIGYELRNILIDDLKGAAKPDKALYRLKVNARQNIEGIAVEPNATTTRYNYLLFAHYELSSMRTGRMLKRGDETTLGAYDVVESPYSTLVAEQAAQKRAAEDIATRIQVDLAVFLRNDSR